MEADPRQKYSKIITYDMSTFHMNLGSHNQVCQILAHLLIPVAYRGIESRVLYRAADEIHRSLSGCALTPCELICCDLFFQLCRFSGRRNPYDNSEEFWVEVRTTGLVGYQETHSEKETHHQASLSAEASSASVMSWLL